MRIPFWLGAFASTVILTAAACGDDFTGSSTTGTGGAGGTAAAGGGGTVFGLALVSPSCGSGDGGTVTSECTSCTTEHCADKLAECFGSAWQTDLEGGVCTDFGACVMACECGDPDCFNACLTQLDAAYESACRSCIAELVTCEQSYCATECVSATPDAGQGGTGSGGHGGHGPDGG
jgi:hypothetical protein